VRLLVHSGRPYTFENSPISERHLEPVLITFHDLPTAAHVKKLCVTSTTKYRKVPVDAVVAVVVTVLTVLSVGVVDVDAVDSDSVVKVVAVVALSEKITGAHFNRR